MFSCPSAPAPSRALRAVVHGGLTKAAAARRFNTTPKTVGKWVERFRKEGVDGLHDHSSTRLWPKFEWVNDRSRRKTRVYQFLYGHGQAETARKIAVVSA
jgi:transposase-like protein